MTKGILGGIQKTWEPWQTARKGSLSILRVCCGCTWLRQGLRKPSQACWLTRRMLPQHQGVIKHHEPRPQHLKSLRLPDPLLEKTAESCNAMQPQAHELRLCAPRSKETCLFSRCLGLAARRTLRLRKAIALSMGWGGRFASRYS